jgi:hypothetical protein
MRLGAAAIYSPEIVDARATGRRDSMGSNVVIASASEAIQKSLDCLVSLAD